MVPGRGYVPEATPEAHREEKETPKEVKEPKEPEHVYEIYVPWTLLFAKPRKLNRLGRCRKEQLNTFEENCIEWL